MTVTCPHCGEFESARVSLGYKTAIIFPCKFSPLVEEGLDEKETQKIIDTWKDDHGDYRDWCEKGHLKALGKRDTLVEIKSKDKLLKKL